MIRGGLEVEGKLCISNGARLWVGLGVGGVSLVMFLVRGVGPSWGKLWLIRGSLEVEGKFCNVEGVRLGEGWVM